MLEYRELREEIEAEVARINTKFGMPGWQPVVYTYENIGPDEIIAWCQVAVIHLNTPVADGMNLIAKEYIAARQKPGTLVISSTMGAAKQLDQALIVPPKNRTTIAHALHKALSMPEKERSERWDTLRQEVEAHQASTWADSFLRALSK
jgi:trehalose 6-phosphate synthase